MDRIYITCIKYVNKEIIDEVSFEHPYSRVMDKLSKTALLLARKTFDSEIIKKLNCERVGVVIASNTGPCSALREHADILSASGFKGINPSKFPNTMLSTVLSRVTTEFDLKGPSTSMYVNSDYARALEYAVVQLEKGSCDLMAVLFVDEGRKGFGILLQNERSLLEHPLAARFYIDCSNQNIQFWEKG